MTIISAETEMSLLNRIRDVTKKNDTIEKWFEKSSNEIKIREEILHFEELMYVSIKLRQEVIKKHQKSRTYEHLEIAKIMKHIWRNYYFSEMKKAIEKYLTTCYSAIKKNSKNTNLMRQ
jgi:hypothetical protein